MGISLGSVLGGFAKQGTKEYNARLQKELDEERALMLEQRRHQNSVKLLSVKDNLIRSREAETRERALAANKAMFSSMYGEGLEVADDVEESIEVSDMVPEPAPVADDKVSPYKDITPDSFKKTEVEKKPVVVRPKPSNYINPPLVSRVPSEADRLSMADPDTGEVPRSVATADQARRLKAYQDYQNRLSKANDNITKFTRFDIPEKSWGSLMNPTTGELTDIGENTIFLHSLANQHNYPKLVVKQLERKLANGASKEKIMEFAALYDDRGSVKAQTESEYFDVTEAQIYSEGDLEDVKKVINADSSNQIRVPTDKAPNMTDMIINGVRFNDAGREEAYGTQINNTFAQELVQGMRGAHRGDRPLTADEAYKNSAAERETVRRVLQSTVDADIATGNLWNADKLIQEKIDSGTVQEKDKLAELVRQRDQATRNKMEMLQLGPKMAQTDEGWEGYLKTMTMMGANRSEIEAQVAEQIADRALAIGASKGLEDVKAYTRQFQNNVPMVDRVSRVIKEMKVERTPIWGNSSKEPEVINEGPVVRGAKEEIKSEEPKVGIKEEESDKIDLLDAITTGDGYSEKEEINQLFKTPFFGASDKSKEAVSGILKKDQEDPDRPKDFDFVWEKIFNGEALDSEDYDQLADKVSSIFGDGSERVSEYEEDKAKGELANIFGGPMEESAYMESMKEVNNNPESMANILRAIPGIGEGLNNLKLWSDLYQGTGNILKEGAFLLNVSRFSDGKAPKEEAIQANAEIATDAFIEDFQALDPSIQKDDVVTLLKQTAYHESHGGVYDEQQGGGPAKGWWQVEPITAKDLLKNSAFIGPKAEGILESQGLSRELLEGMDEDTFGETLKNPAVNSMFAAAKYITAMKHKENQGTA